jgi:hypothetical protein
MYTNRKSSGVDNDVDDGLDAGLNLNFDNGLHETVMM